MIAVDSIALLAGLFVLGIALVVWCVEVFIEAVTRSAGSLGISSFFLAVVLAGVDLENAVLGVTAAGLDLPELALGTVFGEALFVLAVAVGFAGILVPFRIDVPRVYLIMLVTVPLPALALSLGGGIDLLGGGALLALFVPLLAFVYWYERRTETAYLLSEEVQEVVEVAGVADRTPVETAGDPAVESTTEGAKVSTDTVADAEADGRWELVPDPAEIGPNLEDRSGPFNLAVAALAIVGLTVGSLLTVVSAEGIFVAFGISGLAFGATVLSFIASIEELALTVEPVRRGEPQLAVGNVVGSTVFYVTANVGLIALLHRIDTGGAVMTIHWPFFVACLLVVTFMLVRGRVTRLGGAVLVGLYVAYWIVNYA